MADGMMGNPYLNLLNSGLSPEQAQAAVDQQKAMEFANMNPQARIAAGIYGGLTKASRALGVQDPLLQQASQLRDLAQKFDTSTAKGMMDYANALRQLNPQMAQQAAMQAMKMSEQEAKIRKTSAEADEVTAKTARDLRAAEGRSRALQERYPEMSEDIAKSIAEDSKTVAELLKVPKKEAAKTKTVTANGKVLLINEETGETIKEIGKAGKTLEETLGAGLTGLAGIFAKKQGEAAAGAGGKAVGEAAGMIQGKEDALSAVKAAKDLVGKGIYTGGYAPVQEAISKYTGIGKSRLSNTEQYRAMIGEVVIPRLQEFGGNDSVEELNYLRKVVGGEVTLEKKSIERILGQAEQKIQRGIKRIQDQQKAVEQGKPLPTGVSGAKTVSWDQLP